MNKTILLNIRLTVEMDTRPYVPIRALEAFGRRSGPRCYGVERTLQFVLYLKGLLYRCYNEAGFVCDPYSRAQLIKKASSISNA